MKKIVLVVTLLVALVGSAFAGEAGRKYTKATIEGESAKIYNDDKTYQDYLDMQFATFVFEDNEYDKYTSYARYMTEGEIEYYNKKAYPTSKVVFRDRVEFFIISDAVSGIKITMYISDMYQYAILDNVADLCGNLGKRIGNVAEQYTK